MRCAEDFWRGLIPTVCANMYTATDLWPASNSRLQRRQCRFSKRSFLAASLRLDDTVSMRCCSQVRRKIPGDAIGDFAARTKLCSSQMQTRSCTLLL